MREQIKMVVTDLDGTFLRTDKHISKFTANILNELRARNILFVVATARPVRAVNEFLPWLKYDAGIFHNGAVIWNDTERIGGIGVKNPVGIIEGILANYPQSHIAVEVNEKLYANFNAEKIWDDIEYWKTENFSEIKNSVADKIIIEAHSLEEMNQYENYLSDELYLQLSEHTIAMVMNRQATKINGIKMLAEYFGISMEQIVAFGDDYNDIDMLQACGIGVAVSNALEEVKNIADEICDSNDKDGVTVWMEENLL